MKIHVYIYTTAKLSVFVVCEETKKVNVSLLDIR